MSDEEKKIIEPVPPTGGTGHSLFTKSGPVSLGAQKKGSVALGKIERSDETAHIQPPTQDVSSGATSPYTEVDPHKFFVDLSNVPKSGVAEQTSPDVHRVATERRAAISRPTTWSPTSWEPRIDSSSFVHPSASVVGNVIVAPKVFIAPGAMIRGDNEEPIYIGEGSNVQEGVVIRDLPSRRSGVVDSKRLVDVNGVSYSVYIGRGVSICPQAQVHGPARVEDGVYIGMQSLVFWASVGKDVVVEPDCLIMNVQVNPNVFVPAGLKLTNQKMVGELPPLTRQYRFYGIGLEAVSYTHLTLPTKRIV